MAGRPPIAETPLAQALAARGHRYTDVARYLSVDRTTICAWVTARRWGRRPHRHEHLERLCSLLGLRLEQLEALLDATAATRQSA